MGRAYQNRKVSMAKTAAAKTKVYSKYGREIYVCAKAGGTDPSGNLTLRGLIDRAKKDQVPGHVIEKALEKATGGAGEDYFTVRYEGFGPGGCMVLIDCLTDNSNRTLGDVRTCFNKVKAKMGSEGTVAHMFDHAAILAFSAKQGVDEDSVLEALLEADVDVSDVESEEGMITVFTPHFEYNKAKQAIIDRFGEIDFVTDEIQFVPKGSTPISGDDIELMEKFVDMLNDVDDVQNVFHDAEY